MVSLPAFVLAAALAGHGDLVLLDFSAEWCAPCRSMEPTMQRLEQAGYPVRRVNVEADRGLARRFNIGPIPCFVLLKDGREVQRIVGATSYEQLAQLFQQASSDMASSDQGIRGQSPDPLVASPVRPLNPTPGAREVPFDNRPLAAGNPRLVPVAHAANPGLAHGPGQELPPPTAATTSISEHQLTPAHRLALQATVRLRVTDPTGVSKGTGTIIDVHGDEALIVTCGHIFRDSKGQGEIMVDLFAPGTRGPVVGHLLLYEADQRDFGLVSIRPDTTVTPVKVASTSYHPCQGEPIFSVGCNHAADPTVRASTISAIDRYVGHPNIEIYGHPVEGRSGGGLFTADGQIIGICNAADLEEDRGIYAALPTIHLALDKIGQRAIYLESAPPITLASNTIQTMPTAPLADDPGALPVPERIRDVGPTPREVICIVRAPDGSAHVVVVPHPSPELLERMFAESKQQPLPAPQRASSANDPSIAHLSELPSAHRGPVIRAQGY